MAHLFPHITHIQDVLPAIEGRPEFIVGTGSPHFDLVDYSIMDSGTFKADDPTVAALRRECRGLIFHKDGQLARRAFHKFFNAGEVEETQLDKLELQEPHLVLQKLGGSMIAPFISRQDGEIYWASMRGAETYHRKLAGLFARTGHERFVRAADAQGMTAIFEFCSTDNRIVVEYENPAMTLLALRDRYTGQYIDRNQLVSLAEDHGVPVVQPLTHSAGDIAGLVDEVRALKGQEGAVIWFDSGRLAKLKGDWYLQLHKMLAHFNQEKDVARLILKGNQDDLLGILAPEKKAMLVAYQEELTAALKALAADAEMIRKDICEEKLSRKQFAVEYRPIAPVIKAIMFRHFDKLEHANLVGEIVASAINYTSTGTKWSNFKSDCDWSLNWQVDIIDELTS